MRKQRREEKRKEEETASEGAGRECLGFSDVICFYTEVTTQPYFLLVNDKDYASLAFLQ